MKVAKPSKEILQAVTEFVHACEAVLERDKFSLTDPSDNWQDLDDDDPDKIRLLRIRKEIAEEEGIYDERRVDNRIMAYEYLKMKYSNRLGHVNIIAHVLIDNCCDPMESCLEFHPSIEHTHVAREQ